ncbi:MAG: type II toxin-antitoxin system VapC family toxin [Coriobacteriales bacterium]|jgi:PIN domain nuclease of toxin-antitoxin system|nr:type II toxin-antitoxin system VapC family toxin [Coriobacteriales bacterium]
MGSALSDRGDRHDFLLDSCALLWAAKKPSGLGSLARSIIEDPTTRLFLSSISAYELAYKHRLGKLGAYGFIVENYREVVGKLGVFDLPVTLAHAYLAGQMDWPHPDPFDRVIAAQAALENLVLITSDTALSSNPRLETIW